MDKKALAKLMGNRMTAAAMREAGVTRVPVTPKYELAEDVFKRFIAASEPEGDFFEGHLLVSPEEWEKRQKARPVKVSYDPISGEVLSEEAAAEWAGLAPFSLVGGEVVSAADLSAYAQSEGLLSREITSTIARLVFPSGTTPVAPPTALKEAAKRWPYDEDAQEKAGAIRRGVKRIVGTDPTPTSPSQVVHNHGPVGQQVNLPEGGVLRSLGKTRGSQLSDLLMSMFSMEEMRRFIAGFAGGRELLARLPGGVVSPATFTFALVQALENGGWLDRDFFNALQLERPRRVSEILALRDLYGA